MSARASEPKKKRQRARQRPSARPAITLQSTIDAVPVAIGYVDRRERLMAANLAWEHITGLPRKPLLGQKLRAVFGETIYAQLKPHMARAFAGEAVRFEREIEREGLAPRRVQVQYSPDFGPRGAVRGYYYALTDVTERDEALRGRADREALLQAVIDVSHAGVAINAADGTRIEFNDRLCEILGRSREALRSAPWKTITHPDDLASDLANHQAMIDGRIDSALVNKRYLRPDGSIVYARLGVHAIRDASGAVQRVVALVHDVSDIRMAQLHAEAVEQRMRVAADAGGAFAWEWDIANDTLHWHTPPEGLLGPLPPEGRYPDFRALVHPEDRDTFLAAGRATVDTDCEYRCEARLVRTDGDVRWFAARGRLERDNEGNPVRLIGASADIHARKLVERALAESELRFRTIADLVSDWYWEMDTDLRFTWIDGRGLANIGYRQDQLLGRNQQEIAGVARIDRIGNDGAPAAKRHPGQPWRNQRSRIHFDNGRVIEISSSADPRFDAQGELVGYRGVTRDITQFVEAERSLRESESRFRDLVEVSSDWYWEQDRDFRFAVMEGPVQENTGVAGSAFLGKTRWEMPIINLSASDWSAHQALLERHEPFHDLLLRNPDTAEGEHWVYTSGKPIFDATGAFRGYRGVARNATHQVLAERALRESEARFRSLTELSSDWYWEQDAELRFISTEGSGLDRGGISAAAHIGKRRWELPRTEIVGQSWDQHRAVLGARRSFTDLLLRRTSESGTVHYVSVSGEPILGPNGAFLGYRGIARDVSERVALEARNAALAHAIENAGQALCLCDAEDRVVIANHAFGESNRLLAPYLRPGTPFVEFLRAGLRAGNYVQAIGREDEWLAERLARRADGAAIEVLRPNGRWFLVRDERLHDGSVLTVAFDITERKAVEAREAQAREQLRLAVENLHEPMCLTDPQDNFVFVNRRFRELSAGLDALLAPGRPYAEYLRASVASGRRPEATGRASAWVAERLAQRRRGGGPYTIVRDGGITLQTFDQKFEDGSTLSYAIDITDRLRAEQTLRDANTMLEERVKERTAELEAAVRELEAFSYSVSHDLRAPLRAISGHSSILLEDESARLSDDGRRRLDALLRNAARMGELVDDLLELARINRVELNRRSIDLRALALGVAEELQPQYPRSRIEVGDLPASEGDPILVRQILANLIGNALKYSSREVAPRVEVRWEEDEGAYVVRDNGVGFDMDYAHKLFGTFERLHTPAEFEGTGIGLAIVKRVIDRHRGRVWATASAGGGARFYFTLAP